MNPTADPPLDALQLLQSSSLPMLLQHELERLILAGEIRTGERLNESALAVRFGISRGPLREAFRALESCGLLRQAKNRGVYVREVSVAEADEIYDLREALDDLVGRLLARRITGSQRAELHASLERMDAAAMRGDVTGYHALNLRFHDQLVRFTANRKLIATYGRLIKELHLFRLRGLAEGGGLTVSNDEHRGIVAAIEAGDPDAAGAALRAHAGASRRRMHAAIAGTKVTLAADESRAATRGAAKRRSGARV